MTELEYSLFLVYVNTFHSDITKYSQIYRQYVKSSVSDYYPHIQRQHVSIPPDNRPDLRKHTDLQESCRNPGNHPTLPVKTDRALPGVPTWTRKPGSSRCCHGYIGNRQEKPVFVCLYLSTATHTRTLCFLVYRKKFRLFCNHRYYYQSDRDQIR